MKYTVVAAASAGTLDLSGKIFNKIIVTMTDEAGASLAAELLQRPETPMPMAGQILEGTVEDTKFGKRFKKDKKDFGNGGGFRGKSPEERGEIMRQNALGNAIHFVIEKAKYMKQPEALEFISGKQVIEIAEVFAKYTMGTALAQAPAAETPPTPATAAPAPTPPTAAMPGDINLDDIEM